MPSSKGINTKFIQLIDLYIYFNTQKTTFKIHHTFLEVTKKPCDNNLFVDHLTKFWRFLNHFLLRYHHKIHTADILSFQPLKKYLILLEHRFKRMLDRQYSNFYSEKHQSKSKRDVAILRYDVYRIPSEI
jgi:hypothetical protein